jgi:hypothetical protein
MLAIPFYKRQAAWQPPEQPGATVTGWQPPELPKDCKSILVHCGTDPHDFDG